MRSKRQNGNTQACSSWAPPPWAIHHTCEEAHEVFIGAPHHLHTQLSCQLAADRLQERALQRGRHRLAGYRLPDPTKEVSSLQGVEARGVFNFQLTLDARTFKKLKVALPLRLRT